MVPATSSPAERHRPQGPSGELARRLFWRLPRRYDVLAELLSFGQNRRWRAEMVSHVAPAPGGTVLDVATGTAGVAIRLAERSRTTVVVGLDITEPMLRRAAANVESRRLGDRILLVAGRAEELPFADASVDALTFTYLLRYVSDPAATLSEMARVVRGGSAVACLDFTVPPRLRWRALWWLYTRLVLPVAGRPFGREWYDVGRFLGRSISSFHRRHPPEAVVAAWEAAGLTCEGVRLMSLGGGLVMWGRKRDD